MQLTELVIYNNPTPYFIAHNDEYKKGKSLVVNVGGFLELASIKTENINLNPNDVVMVEFVRFANQDDIRKKCENCVYVRELLPEIKKEVKKSNLDMKISFISTSLDRAKLTINYTADERVDFRNLIKLLGAKFKTRIEMKQIGNRDESKVVGAVGICGRETCCKLYLTDFDKVSIKMAKNQNISLNPTRINGMCGRLLCCLKYEDDFYEEMNKKMPRNGVYATTPNGKGIVVGSDVLKETVTVEFTKDDTTERKIYPLKDINFTRNK